MATLKQTNRGFNYLIFQDSNGQDYSLQESSSATQPKVWLGIEDPHPKVLMKHGWRDINLDEIAKQQVHLSTRMHLTQEQARELIQHLQKFVDTGRLRTP